MTHDNEVLGGAAFFHEDHHGHTKIPGKQTIDRGEAFALLYTLVSQDEQHNIIIYLDSQTTLDGVNQILHRPSIKQWKHISNYSILAQCAQIINRRTLAGARTELLKVKSHSGLTDRPSLLNNGADRYANIARIDPHVDCLIHECTEFLPLFYLVHNDSIVENKSFNVIFKLIDVCMLEENRLSCSSKHFKDSILYPVWWEAAGYKNRLGIGDIFSFKLLYRCLLTPRNIKMFNGDLTEIFKHSFCPLHFHDNEVCNEFHIFCVCRSIEATRRSLILNVLRKLNSFFNLFISKHSDISHFTMDYNTLRSFLAPSSELDFAYGKPSINMKFWLINRLNSPSADTHISKMTRKIYTLVTTYYHELWKSFLKSMENKGVLFKQQLMHNYGITVDQLKDFRGSH